MNEKNTLRGVTSAHPEYNDTQVQAMLDAIIKEDESQHQKEEDYLRSKIEWLEETSEFHKNSADVNWNLYISADKRADFWKNFYEETKDRTEFWEQKCKESTEGAYKDATIALKNAKESCAEREAFRSALEAIAYGDCICAPADCAQEVLNEYPKYKIDEETYQ